MRLLFLNSRSADYLQDQLFSGLTELLGAENVIPYPINRNYYLPRKPYPRDLGHCRGIIDYPRDWLHTRRALKHHEFDAVVIGSTKRDIFETFLALRDDLPKGIPLIYIDGGDWPEVGGDAERMDFAGLLRDAFSTKQPDIIFKRECLIGKKYEANVHPLPMGYGPAPVIGEVPKKYDVTCWCVESHPIRTQALTLLEDRYDCRANGTTRGQKFRTYKRKGTNYLRELAASRIACNFRGVGWDTMRYWETPGVGTCLVSQRPQIEIPNDFIHDEHVIFCHDDLSDLIPQLNELMRDNVKRREIADASHRYVNKYHSYISRAERFLGLLNAQLLI